MDTVLHWLQGTLGDGGLFVVLSVVLGWFGRPLVQWLKEKLGWDDKKALGLAMGIAVGLAVLQAVILGVLDVQNITPDGIVASAGLIYATANVLYRWFRTGEAPVGLPEEGKDNNALPG